MLNRLLRLGAFQNPEFFKAQAMRLPTFNKPRVIACGEELADHIALPRGCLAEVIELLKSHRIKPRVRDERSVGRPIEVGFSGRLRPLQQDAVDAFAQHDEGIDCAPTFLARRQSRMVDCVTEGEHIDLGAPSTVAGPVACEIGNVFSVFPQSQSAKSGEGWPNAAAVWILPFFKAPTTRKGVKDFVAEYGQVIVDECHHLSPLLLSR